MNAEKFLESIAADLKTRKELDPEVTRHVIELLVLNDDPAAEVEGLELALYKTAMRRAGGK